MTLSAISIDRNAIRFDIIQRMNKIHCLMYFIQCVFFGFGVKSICLFEPPKIALD